MYDRPAIISVEIFGECDGFVSLDAIRFKKKKKISFGPRKSNYLLDGPDLTFRARKVKNSSAMKNVKKVIETLLG